MTFLRFRLEINLQLYNHENLMKLAQILNEIFCPKTDEMSFREIGV